ncbi:MAG: uracil-DNA glycosylase [Anaerolineales bacterium]|nr:uracil-DNA glycosylase [Anaerolineales bacterium]
MDPTDILKQVAREVATCEKCELHFSRKNAVPGEGPVNAEMVFIGEGPGFHENEQGRPFVGAAGKFLEELLAKIGLSRQQVYITNVVKCRPPGNRDPKPEEVEVCTNAYLERQLQAINPKVIITLGRHSMGLYLANAKISDVHGQALRVKGRLIVPMYHPAAALHQASLKPVLENDFARLPELIARAAEAPEQSEPIHNEPKEPPTQLSLF